MAIVMSIPRNISVDDENYDLVKIYHESHDAYCRAFIDSNHGFKCLVLSVFSPYVQGERRLDRYGYYVKLLDKNVSKPNHDGDL